MSFTERTKAPFRLDVVGSFLRPDVIKEARAAYADGAISAEQLKAVEDRCITELVEKELAAGLRCVTDGEFRRSYWHLDFMPQQDDRRECAVLLGRCRSAGTV